MSSFPFILADDFGNWGKLIGIGIVAIFWGIGALSSLVKKANEQARRNAAQRPLGTTSRAQAFQPAAQVVQTASSQNQRMVVSAFRGQAPPQHAKQIKAAQKPAVRAVQPVPPALPPMQNAPVSRAGATTAPKPAIGQPAAPQTRAGGANAATIRRWLQPGTIRRQFILTELFQPPLTLREPPKRD